MARARNRRPRGTPPNQACFAPPRVARPPIANGHSVHYPTTDEPIRIPSTPFGIVDTIRAKLNHIADEDECRDLFAQESWSKKSNGHSVVFKRAADGLRVILIQGNVWVEASVPRVLGLHSDEQHRVAVQELLDGFDLMTAKLLPKTTESAAAIGTLWHVVRMDLAINFRGPLLAITEVARKLNFRPLIRPAATVFEERGIGFYGQNHDAVCYRTDKRPNRGKLSKDLRDQTFTNKTERMLRMEYRYKSPKAVRKLMGGMKLSPVGLPFLVELPDGTEEVRTFDVDYHLLHRKLATQAAKMGSQRILESELPSKGSSRFAIEVLARFGDTHPELWLMLESCLSDRQARTKRRLAGLIQAATRDWDIVSLGWPRPRISELLRRRLLAQIANDPDLARAAS